jgi:hypothetical protein
MPVWNTSRPGAAAPKADQKPHHFIIDRIRQDKVVPVVSNDISYQLLLGQDTALVNSYAEYIQYPFSGQYHLSQMTQFRVVMQKEQIRDPLALRTDYIDFIKNILYANVAQQATTGATDILDDLAEEFDDIPFSEFARRLGQPRVSLEPKNPLELLAAFPLSIYLTTSYHHFLEAALAQAGKIPHTEICRWRKELETIPSVLRGDYRPSKDAPLVYHLFGCDAYPESLVLTEDDHLEFLVAVSRDDGRGGVDLIPARVRGAIADSSLMLLGYSLRGWDFRVIFRGLLKPSTLQQQGVSIQLAPDEVEQEYLQKYLQYEAKFEVHWTDSHTFLAQLRQELES